MAEEGTGDTGSLHEICKQIANSQTTHGHGRPSSVRVDDTHQVHDHLRPDGLNLSTECKQYPLRPRRAFKHKTFTIVYTLFPKRRLKDYIAEACSLHALKPEIISLTFGCPNHQTISRDMIKASSISKYLSTFYGARHAHQYIPLCTARTILH